MAMASESESSMLLDFRIQPAGIRERYYRVTPVPVLIRLARYNPWFTADIARFDDSKLALHICLAFLGNQVRLSLDGYHKELPQLCTEKLRVQQLSMASLNFHLPDHSLDSMRTAADNWSYEQFACETRLQSDLFLRFIKPTVMRFEGIDQEPDLHTILPMMPNLRQIIWKQHNNVSRNDFSAMHKHCPHLSKVHVHYIESADFKMAWLKEIPLILANENAQLSMIVQFPADTEDAHMGECLIDWALMSTPVTVGGRLASCTITISVSKIYNLPYGRITYNPETTSWGTEYGDDFLRTKQGRTTLSLQHLQPPMHRPVHGWP